ncbi:MAG TPA: hypothetical protein VFA75_06950 [Nevskia sp.]|nr:hypothetical protein [Nevskia sp.]
MKPMLRKFLMLALALPLLPACGLNNDRSAPTRPNFKLALEQTLATRGDVCLAMFDWPIDLTPAEAGAGARHAVQLPVFEKLGLASSTVVEVPKTAENPQGVVKRYALTEEGSKYYKAHAYTSRGGAEHPRDFCVAHIRPERVVGWQLDQHDAEHPTAVVSYTYQVDPAPWLQDADAQRVLPMVARIVKGAGGGLQLRQGFVLGEHGWVAMAGPV